jgi:hypothetical protein
MSCHGLHQICQCNQELIDDMRDSLSGMVKGLESMLAEYPKMRNLIYKDFGIGLPSAKSVLRRANKI